MSHKSDSDPAHGWPKQEQFRRSIRLEFSLYVSAAILGLMLVTGYLTTSQYVKTVTDHVVDRLLVQSRSFASSASKHIIGVERPDDLMLTSICSKFATDNPDVYWVGIVDASNVFLAHTDIREVVAGSRLKIDAVMDYRRLLREGELLAFVGDTITLAIPIKENGVLLGRLALGASSKQIAEARNHSITAIASVTAIMLLIGIPLTMVVVNRKLRPISIISRQLQQMDLEQLTIDLPIRTRNEFGYLAETLRYMTARVRESKEQALENERVTRELEIAREIQASILPLQFPRSQCFESAGAYISAKQVGGDYYDFIDLDDRHLGILIADVSGKSLPGMLVMLLTRDIVKNTARSTSDPAELLKRVNSELVPNIRKGMFVTMAFASLDTTTGEFAFACAGHNPLIWLSRRTGKAELVKTNGYPLGLMPPELFNRRLERRQIMLEAGDVLVQYTDGVNEARSRDGQEYGLDRIVESVTSNRNLPPAELVERTMQAQKAFVGAEPQFDDITLIVLKWCGRSANVKRDLALETSNAN